MLFSVRRACTDVLAHPNKEPLMLALPTKDRATNKESIVICLLRRHPQKEKKVSSGNDRKQALFVTMSNNTLTFKVVSSVP